MSNNRRRQWIPPRSQYRRKFPDEKSGDKYSMDKKSILKKVEQKDRIHFFIVEQKVRKYN